MKPVAILGVLLIVVGLVALAYQGFTYTRRDQAGDDQQHAENRNRFHGSFNPAPCAASKQYTGAAETSSFHANPRVTLRRGYVEL